MDIIVAASLGRLFLPPSGSPSYRCNLYSTFNTLPPGWVDLQHWCPAANNHQGVQCWENQIFTGPHADRHHHTGRLSIGGRGDQGCGKVLQEIRPPHRVCCWHNPCHGRLHSGRALRLPGQRACYRSALWVDRLSVWIWLLSDVPSSHGHY